jgi:hypothetical protein
VIVGHDVGILADDESRARDLDGFARVGRAFVSIVVGLGGRFSSRRLSLGIGKIASDGNAAGLDRFDAIFDGGDDIACRA